MIKRILFTLCFMSLLCYLGYLIFSPLYFSKHIIIDYGIHPFDICVEQPTLWLYCKYWFVFTYLFTSFFLTNSIFRLLHNFFIRLFYTKTKVKKVNSKKEKTCYSFIDHSLSPPNLRLLIRRKRKNERINLYS